MNQTMRQMQRARQLLMLTTTHQIISAIMTLLSEKKEERRQRFKTFFTAVITRAKFRRTIQMKGRTRRERNQRAVKQSMTFLSVLKAIPLMPKVNKLFRTFIERSAVVL